MGETGDPMAAPCFCLYITPLYVKLAGIPGFARDSCIFSRRTLATAGQNPVVLIASLHPYFLPHPSGVKGEH